jgi:hypothetical protein
VKPNGIACELQLPLGELDLALQTTLQNESSTLVAEHGAMLSEYIRSHIHLAGNDGTEWALTVGDMKVQAAEQTDTGPYRALNVQLWFQSPSESTTRQFTLYYDAIIHQVLNHNAFVAIRQDWDNGRVGEDQTEVGVISLDPRNNTIPPLRINLDEGSIWQGFGSMVKLGMKHIAEGTDHLLFLLVLLLPAPLLVRNRRWEEFGGTRYSILKLLRITGAFTIGHSLTLLAGSVGWLRLPSQPVEILIAVSILVTAIHAIRPFFAGNEVYIAGGFGLIHGLAFASTLGNLNLEAGRMALSILGFNAGIELMQLFIVMMTMPWLILMSTAPSYRWVRSGGALVAATAAVAWIVERVTLHPNAVSLLATRTAEEGKWLVLGLATMAMASYLWRRKFREANNTSVLSSRT